MKKQDVIIDTTSGSLLSCSNLAITLTSQGRKKEAILMMETCVQLHDWVFGSPHPITVSLLRVLNEWQTKDKQINH